MQAQQPQLDLKDIHLPDAVSWWPPAIGYWLVLAVIIIVIIAYISIKAYRKKYAVKRLALTEFEVINLAYKKDQDQKKLITSLSELLRRAAISTYPSTDCASLTGEEWLDWLDSKHSKSTYKFSTNSGYLLTKFIYSNDTHADHINDFIKLCQLWLKQLPATGKNS